MTLEEFEAEAERLGFRKKEEEFVPHFEHAASGRRVDYIAALGNCHIIDCERTLAALRAALEPGGAAVKRGAPAAPRNAEDWMNACGVSFRKAPAALGWSLRRLQEEALSRIVGRSVVVSEATAKGEAVEVPSPVPGHGKSWLVLHPADAEVIVKRAAAPGKPSEPE